jgi:hypothetical protein
MTATSTTTAQYANQIGYTDIRAHEVVRTVSDTCLEVRRMKAIGEHQFEFSAGGYGGVITNINDQFWKFESDPTEPIIRIRLSKAKRTNGQWRDSQGREYRLTPHPVEFYDYNF